jgi:DNA-binding response OmpR family regulator
MRKLLIIDDDVSLSTELQKILEQHDWRVERADNGKDGLQLLRCSSYDFILLDWNMPEMDGIDVCRRFREEGGQTPIIFLTGRHELDDKESGLDAGGDDYLTKPFEPRELLARMRTIERRPRSIVRETMTLNKLEFDPKLRRATVDGAAVQLSLTESNILEFLLRHRNAFFTASQIFASVWPSDSEASAETVRVHMQYLRGKLARIGADKVIETVKGAGYTVRDEG